MIKALLFFGCFCMISYPAFAEEINFSALSRQALDNEITRSPVYTKMLYRQIYENDTADYNRQMQYLENQKKQAKLSAREYLAQVEVLKKAYQQAHPQTLDKLGDKITQAPAEMLLDATFTNRRRPLMLATQTKETAIKKTRPVTTIQSSADNQNVTTPAAENMAVIKLNKTQKLGRKSLRINLDAFK